MSERERESYILPYSLMYDVGTIPIYTCRCVLHTITVCPLSDDTIVFNYLTPHEKGGPYFIFLIKINSSRLIEDFNEFLSHGEKPPYYMSCIGDRGGWGKS